MNRALSKWQHVDSYTHVCNNCYLGQTELLLQDRLLFEQSLTPSVHNIELVILILIANVVHKNKNYGIYFDI